MPKTITKIILAFSLALASSQFVFATSVDQLVPRDIMKDSPYSDSSAVSKLPNVTIEAAITSVIKTVLGWSIIFTLAALIVAAVYYLIAQGKEDEIGKSKDIIVYLVIGLAIMSAAYGIVTGILKFKFFE